MAEWGLARMYLSLGPARGQRPQRAVQEQTAVGVEGKARVLYCRNQGQRPLRAVLGQTVVAAVEGRGWVPCCLEGQTLAVEGGARKGAVTVATVRAAAVVREVGSGPRVVMEC